MRKAAAYSTSLIFLLTNYASAWWRSPDPYFTWRNWTGFMEFLPSKSIDRYLNDWLSELKIDSKSDFSFFLSQRKDEDEDENRFGVRFIVIIPSEYSRTSSQEWDKFEVVFSGYNNNGIDDLHLLAVSVENYRVRHKSMLSGNVPMPDWEFSTTSSSEIDAYRLQSIGQTITRIAKNDALNFKLCNQLHEKTLICAVRHDYPK